ncbi:hypothetical protein HQ399_15390 [Aeromonas jandaei]|uniref:Helix-turn-helix domain-containing protein n=2 Tax=Aeromonas TaxID=642 RepID=A0ABD7ER90_AERJA|nr:MULTISPECIES: hypothetical protein [Aeromonas]MBL0658233.1 hypothetical protein [Aeromonas dhakensis]MBL0638300.1 hypothetical protein [Aeromonas veronii]MCF5865776.1 hypothetical protein [Aeromonas veronii]MCJ8233498.1 hypothetical protein [Aeromonas veronii]MCZ0752520.1 hypothetical protein [Aeromonas enteropelogenes]
MMRRTPPELESQAAAAIAAGWPITAISQQTGLSPATLRRIRARTKTIPGSLRAELIEEARASLLDSLGVEFVRMEAARLVRSQAAICERILSQSWELLERLGKEDKTDPLKVARAISSIATASKLASDSLRQVLTLGADPEGLEELPELIVRDLTAEEVEAIREDVDAAWLAVSEGKEPPIDGL